MFALKFARVFRRPAMVAGLVLTTSMGLSVTAMASDDLFEPLPDGRGPAIQSDVRDDDFGPFGNGDTSQDGPADGDGFSNNTNLDTAGDLTRPTSGAAGQKAGGDAASQSPIAATPTDADLFGGPAPTPGSDKTQAANRSSKRAGATTAVEAPGAGNAPTLAEPAIPVFDQHARQKLAAEIDVRSSPHPLALQYPDHFTVVCEAGCLADDEDIVYQERRDARGPVNQSADDMKTLPTAAAKNVVLCVGGCYHGERVAGPVADLSARVPSHASVPSQAGDRSWMTNGGAVAPGSSRRGPPASGGRRWYDRIGG